MPPPLRIVVVGTCGSGKSTFAARLAAGMGIPHLELDALFWDAGWTPVPTEEFTARVREAVAADTWALAGNYKIVREIVWSRATHVVWLDHSFPLTMWRLLRRTLRRVVTREVIWGNNRESLRLTLSKESVLVWALNTYHPNRVLYEGLMQDPQWKSITFHRVHTRTEADALATRLIFASQNI